MRTQGHPRGCGAGWTPWQLPRRSLIRHAVAAAWKWGQRPGRCFDGYAHQAERPISCDCSATPSPWRLLPSPLPGSPAYGLGRRPSWRRPGQPLLARVSWNGRTHSLVAHTACADVVTPSHRIGDLDGRDGLACRPGSVPPYGGGDHPSTTAVAGRLQRSTRVLGRAALERTRIRRLPDFGWLRTS
jgi:hypothetical protein